MQQQPQRRPKKGNGFSWIGLLIFLVFAIGPRFLPLVRSLFSSTSLALPANIPAPLLVVGVIVLVVVASGAVRVVRAAQRGSEMRPPTTVTPQSLDPTSRDARRSSAPMPPFGGAGMPFPPTVPPMSPSQTPSSVRASTNYSLPSLTSLQQLPSAPRFEPIITGKAVVASLGLVLLFGLVYVLASALG